MVRSMSTRGVTEVQVPIAMGKGKQRFGKYRAGSAPTSVPRISNGSGSGSGSTGTVSTVKDDQSVFSYKQPSVGGDGDDFSVYDNMSVYDMSVVDGASCFAGGDSVMGESLFDEQSMYHDNTVYGDEHSYQQHIDPDEELPMEDTSSSIPTNILLEDNSTKRNKCPQIDTCIPMNDESHTSFSHSHCQLDHEDDVHNRKESTPATPTTITTTTTASTTPTSSTTPSPHAKTAKPVPILRNKNKTNTNTNTNTVISVAPTDESSYETPSPESTPKRTATTTNRPSLAHGKKQKSTLWTSFKLSTKKSKSKNGKKTLFTKLFKRTKAEF